MLSKEKFGGCKTEVKKGGKKKSMKTYLHGPMDYVKTPQLQFRARGLDLPERRKRYTSSREEEEDDAQRCPCGKVIENRTHVLREC